MKKIQILLVLLLSSVSLWAGPIGEQRARQIAEEFFAQNATRSTADELTLEWAGDVISETPAMGSELNTSLMYIYNRGQNGGFVVIAGDSNIAPIIAYSFDTTLDISNMAEATRAILDAWCREVAHARQAAKPVSGGSYDMTTRANGELRYDTALWNQGEPYNWEAPIYDGYRSVTGCVATAMSIICHYNKWPEKGVGTTPEYSYEDAYGVSRSVAANTLGRTYNYSNMLMDYNSGYTTTQGDEKANFVDRRLRCGLAHDRAYRFIRPPFPLDLGGLAMVRRYRRVPRHNATALFARAVFRRRRNRGHVRLDLHSFYRPARNQLALCVHFFERVRNYLYLYLSALLDRVYHHGTYRFPRRRWRIVGEVL